MTPRSKGHTNHQPRITVEFAAVWTQASKAVRNEVWGNLGQFQQLVVDHALNDPHSTPSEIAKQIKEPTKSVSDVISSVMRELREFSEVR